jgi:hypothetical protein
MKTLMDEAYGWIDTEECNRDYVDRFTQYVNETPYLKDHRDYIERTAYGFGERAFHWLWKLVVDDMPQGFRFLEVGVYKGQVLSLVQLIARYARKSVEVYGVTPLSRTSGPTGKFTKFPDCDYAAMIHDLHVRFALTQPNIIPYDSTCPHAKQIVDKLDEFDVVYVDGCHEYDYVVKDLMYYPEKLRVGGLLVVDDSANNLHQPWGYFQGIEDVSRAVRTIIEPDSRYVHLFACMHNRVWRKIGG